MPRDRSDEKSTALVVSNSGLVASGLNVSLRRKKGKTVKVRKDDWQARAWIFYDTVGEFRFAANWVGNLISKAKLFPQKDGKITTDARAVAALEGLFGGPQYQPEMLRQIGIQLTVAGDTYLVGYDGGASDPDKWEVVSNFRIQPYAQKQFKIDQDIAPNGTLVVRVWRPHPLNPKAADAPSRAVLPVLSELQGLTMRVAADIDSRLVGAGLLLIPSEISFPAIPVKKGTGADEEAIESRQQNNAQGLIDLLVEVAATAIGDQESAAARVPIVLQGPADALEQVRLIDMATAFDEQTEALRTEAIRRLSLGMDMPPEVLTGTGGVNHWSGWQIEEAAIKAHTEPFLQLIASSLTEGFYTAALMGEGMTLEEAEEYSIGVDTSALRLRPNRSKEAEELYDRGELTGEALRRENGFDEDDAPDANELKAWFTKKVASGSTTPELVAEALRMLGLAFPVTQPEAPTTEARPIPSLEEHPTQDPPEEGDPNADDAGLSIIPAAAVAASEVMVFRALERAGNKLKNRLGAARPEGVAAADLYMYVPQRSTADIELLLDDAWSCADRFETGLPAEWLTRELHTFTMLLIADRRKYDRSIMAGYLTGRAIMEGVV